MHICAGGRDFDQRVVEHLVKLYKKKTGKDLCRSNEAVHKLRREVEKAKRTLSSVKETRIKIDSLFNDDDFSETLTRAMFEGLNKDLFLSAIQQITKVLEYGDLGKGNVDDLVLIGGSTKIPKVQQMVKEYFEQKVDSRFHRLSHFSANIFCKMCISLTYNTATIQGT
jgi:heat shock protein 5